MPDDSLEPTVDGDIYTPVRLTELKSTHIALFRQRAYPRYRLSMMVLTRAQAHQMYAVPLCFSNTKDLEMVEYVLIAVLLAFVILGP
jgi:hypothetical protein